jgi:hypothetical protein
MEKIMDDSISRFLGGPPAWVVTRLVLLSIVVGVILSAFGLDPFNIVRSLERLVRAIWEMGWDAITWIWRYFLLGAVLVLPIWFVMRFFRASGRRDFDRALPRD